MKEITQVIWPYLRDENTLIILTLSVVAIQWLWRNYLWRYFEGLFNGTSHQAVLDFITYDISENRVNIALRDGISKFRGYFYKAENEEQSKVVKKEKIELTDLQNEISFELQPNTKYVIESLKVKKRLDREIFTSPKGNILRSNFPKC